MHQLDRTAHLQKRADLLVASFADSFLDISDGRDVGFRSDVLLWPAETTGVVVMMNDESGNPGELSQIIFSVLLAKVGGS